ncbi:MAG: hypothetical protein QNJ32_28315 [Xenococcaceae cyanobacterium MO_167.B27]|nr:hypothetical protein [Xenococcaceae cyanobacterium MO_167.B27]
MEVLKLTTEIDETGQLKIDLHTNLEAGKVDLVVIVNPLVEKAKGLSNYDFSDLEGKLSWQGNAVAEQRQLRDEW